MTTQQKEIRNHLERARRALTNATHQNFGALFDLLNAAIDVNANTVSLKRRAFGPAGKLAKHALRLNPLDRIKDITSDRKADF